MCKLKQLKRDKTEVLNWREERKLRAIELKMQGWTHREIAQEIGITESGVSHLLSRAKRQPPRLQNGKVISKETILVWDVLRHKEWTQSELAREMNLTDRTVRHWVSGTRKPDANKLETLKQLLLSSKR